MITPPVTTPPDTTTPPAAPLAASAGPAAVACCWQPDPTRGNPPPCWIASATARQRLEHACAVLRWYGIAAHTGLGDNPDFIRTRLLAAIRADFPDADGAYLFWTAPDDHAGFTADGALTGPLTVYVGGSAIGQAARAALDCVGFTAADGPKPGTLLVRPS